MSDFSKAFLTGLGGGLAGVPGAVIATGLNVAGSMYAQKRSEENQRRINEQNRQWQLEDRKHDEMYNSPAMQKARMMDAGIGGDYSQLVSPIATQSNTATAQAPSNAMDALGALGNTASTSFANAMNTGMNYASASAEYELRKAQAVTEAQKAEQLRIENQWKPVLNALDEKLGNAELVSKNLDIKNKEIANYVADGMKDITIRLGQLQVESTQIQLEGDRLRNDGLKLSNDLTELQIAGEKIRVDEILPLQVEELKKNIQLLGDDHEKNIKELRAMDDAHKAAVYALFGMKLQNLTDKATYDALEKNYEKYCKSIDKKVRGQIRNSNYENAWYNTGGMKDLQGVVDHTVNTVESSARSFGSAIFGALLLKGFGMSAPSGGANLSFF